jgi:hypothetical protein
MSILLPVGSLLYFDTGTDPVNPTWSKITEHNRQPLSITKNRIQKVQRMANGTLRKFFVAEKREFSVSWTMLPTFSNMTVDGGYAKDEIESFYETSKGQGTFKIKIVYGKEQTSPYAERSEIVTVSLSSCSFELLKRNVKARGSDPAQEFWNASLSMEEV